METKKKLDLLHQFLFFPLPIIIIIGVIIYGNLSDSKKEISVKDKSSNPFEYDISDMKKVPSDLIHYSEKIEKIPIQIKSPSAFTLKNDTFYVTGKNSVVKLNLTGKLLAEYKINGTPVSIDVSDHGDIAICFEKALLLLDKTGRQLLLLGEFPEKTMFTSIAIDGDFLYVTDAGRGVLLQFNRNGDRIREIGKRDHAAGVSGFIVPSFDFDVISANDGTVWVVNPGRHQLENYTSDGKLRSSWNAPATGVEGFSGCCNPTRIVLLRNGDFVTAEKHIIRVKVYSPAGVFKCVVAAPDKFATDGKIIDIAVDSEGKIYILDSNSDALRVFMQKKERDSNNE